MPSATAGTGAAIRAAGLALFIFSLFPYLSLVTLPTDTQPYAIIFAVLRGSAFWGSIDKCLRNWAIRGGHFEAAYRFRAGIHAKKSRAARVGGAR